MGVLLSKFFLFLDVTVDYFLDTGSCFSGGIACDGFGTLHLFSSLDCSLLFQRGLLLLGLFKYPPALVDDFLGHILHNYSVSRF